MPSRIYFSNQFLSLHRLNESYRYHWSEYKGDYKQREGILLLFDIASSLAPFGQLNIIRYSRQNLIIQEKKFSTFDPDKKGNEIMTNMLCTKLPERIMYGLLRGMTLQVQSDLLYILNMQMNMYP
ncbi:hypothetical protein QNH10_08915 [Sporosarcina thermotolerans]|uniref:hypothetical protein n=1 Tax=Sporosarcina thermotolerans TaxID=633404 RepID=UPI0024BCA2F0|nr:hypothetical protein [Sporosarcina thermotolerans]WHT49603.1 hypothetical protein QNH10_08915 [Sporosarcina thermotolerans]